MKRLLIKKKNGYQNNFVLIVKFLDAERQTRDSISKFKKEENPFTVYVKKFCLSLILKT